MIILVLEYFGKYSFFLALSMGGGIVVWVGFLCEMWIFNHNIGFVWAMRRDMRPLSSIIIGPRWAISGLIVLLVG